MTIVFTVPLTSFSGFFTYSAPLTLDGFDASLSSIASVAPAFASNLAISGDFKRQPARTNCCKWRPQIFFQSELTGDSGGGSFVIDDAMYLPADTTPPPAGALTPSDFHAACTGWPFLSCGSTQAPLTSPGAHVITALEGFTMISIRRSPSCVSRCASFYSSGRCGAGGDRADQFNSCSGGRGHSYDRKVSTRVTSTNVVVGAVNVLRWRHQWCAIDRGPGSR